MSDRVREIISQTVVILGFAVPFVIGAFSESLMLRINRLHHTASLRSRFDAVQAGMTDSEVEARLGTPSDDMWIDATHAETWFIEAGAVSHKTWGPPWKVYWLQTSADGKSRWWSGNGSQAFVLYDDNRKVNGKIWFERRSNSDGNKAIPLSCAVAVGAFSVWLAVRVVNRTWCQPLSQMVALLRSMIRTERGRTEK